MWLGHNINYEIRNNGINQNTILQLDSFCKKKKKWSEVPYVQAFMALYQNPFLCLDYQKLHGKDKCKPEPDIIDDPLLNTPPALQREAQPLPYLFPLQRLHMGARGYS